MLLALISVSAVAGVDESIQQMAAHAEAASPGDRPGLYMKIAHQQAESADKFYQSGDSEAGSKALSDVVTYSQKASDAAGSTGKRLKDTEIALRKIAEKFRDVKHNLPFDDQAPVQQAIDRLENMRTDLLTVMFGKKNKK